MAILKIPSACCCEAFYQRVQCRAAPCFSVDSDDNYIVLMTLALSACNGPPITAALLACSSLDTLAMGAIAIVDGAGGLSTVRQ